MTRLGFGEPLGSRCQTRRSGKWRTALRLWLGGMALAGSAWGGSLASAQDSTGFVAPEESDFGAIGRAGHLAFPTFGRGSSITPLEAFPYLIDGNNFYFGDFRGFLSNNGNLGGNLGLGYRYLDEGMLAWYGASAWYDGDHTTGTYFQQLGLSLEGIIENWEVRTNMYLPVGDTRQSFGAGTFASRFVGNQLLFDSTRRYGSAMKGIDFEIGYGLPLDLFGWDNRVRGFLGGYFFDGSSVKNINGFKARGEFVLNSAVTTQLLYTTDSTFGDNVMLGMTFDFPWGDRHPSSRWGRAMPSPYRVVERNYNVIVSRYDSDLQGVVAINPATGLPYNVEHVSATGTAGGDGTLNNSYATVAQAQAAGGNLLFVHADTVLSEQIILANGQQLLGESAGQRVTAQGYGSILLPGTGGTAAPRISGVAGPAVTFASNSVFSGFKVDTIAGPGVVGNGVDNATVRNVTFSGISGDALSMTNGTGTFNLESLLFQSTGGRGLVIDGGNANYNIAAGFDHVAGDALVVQNTTGGTVTVSNLLIEDSSARGVVASGLAGTFVTNNVAITGSGGDAFVVDGGTGSVALQGLTSITNSLARGLVLNNTASDITIENLNVTSTSPGAAVTVQDTTGEISIDRLVVDVNGGQGLVADNADHLDVGQGTIVAVGAAGVNLQDSDVAIQLGGIAVDGGPVGIRIVDTTGSFSVTGVTKGLGGGGTIKNTGTAVLLDHAGTVALQRMNFFNNNLGVSSVGSGYVLVDYAQFTGTTHYAIDSLNDQLVSLSNSLISTSGALGEGTIRLRADAFGSYQTQILSSTIVDTNGTAIEYSNSGAANGSAMGLLMQNNNITGTRGGASVVKVNWNGPIGLTLDHNQFTMTATNMLGLDVAANSATDKLTATLTSNIFNASDSGTTAVRMTAASTSTLQFGGNGIAFDGGNGRGFEFALAGASNVVFDSNQIIDNAFGATGVLFDSIANASTVTFNGNTMQFLSPGLVVDRGIVFTTVNGTIQLVGNRNNTIVGATTNFTAPAGTTTGQIKINGANVP